MHQEKYFGDISLLLLRLSDCLLYSFAQIVKALIYGKTNSGAVIQESISQVLPDTETIVNRLKSLDVYRKVPQDLTEPTLSGAIVSIVCTIIMSLLFISELTSYLSIRTDSEMFIDVNRGGDKLQVNIDIDVFRTPCGLLSLDAQDVMGSHEIHVGGSLHKHRMDKEGNQIGEKELITGDHQHSNEIELLNQDEITKQVNDLEGCKLSGFILINKVPGNFHISAHAQSTLMQSIYQGQLWKMDLSHKVNHLSFGPQDDLDLIQKQVFLVFRNFKVGVLNPLDGYSSNKQQQTNSPTVYEYYVKVVPTTYHFLDKDEKYVYQFTSNANIINANIMPSIWFRYDLSPVTVKFSQYRTALFHFLVQVCAIVGGVFTVAGIIDSLIHRTTSSFLKKGSLGKAH